MRLGLFGGTFDPVHYGHLILAECCREECRLDEVRLLPTAVPPHKRGRQLTAAEPRIEMLELAVAGHPAFSVSRYETARGGVNYTVDTLTHFQQENPEAELFFLMGADMLRDLPRWRNAGEVCRLATIVAVRRPDTDPLDFDCLAQVTTSERIEHFRENQVEMPPIGFSSTEIRRRVGENQSIRYRTPRAVEEYIREHGLYTRHFL